MPSETTKSLAKVRVISCAWGGPHIDDFLDYCLPALLAPGNLPALCQKFPVELVFLTEEAQFDRIAQHPSWQVMNRLCPARLVSLDDLLIGPDSYGMSLTQALHRGFADLGPAMTEHWQVFFNSDFIAADGSLARLAQAMAEGHRLILSPSYCVNEEAVKPILDRAKNADECAIAIPRRTMADIMLRHRHATVSSKIVNHGLFSFLYTDQFYRMVDDYTLIGRQVPIAMVALMPERYLPSPTTYWDYGVVADFVPDSQPHVLGDSDDFLMIELRGTNRSQEALVLGPRSQADLSSSLGNFASRETVRIAKHRLVVHSQDLPDDIEQQQRILDEFVDQVVSGVKSLQPGQGHFQWAHHFDRFREAQQRYQAGKIAERESIPADCELSARYTPPVQLFPRVEPQIASSAPSVNSNWTAQANAQEPDRDAESARATHRLLEIIRCEGPLDNGQAIELVSRFAAVAEAVRRGLGSAESGGPVDDLSGLKYRIRRYLGSPQNTAADISAALSAPLAQWLAMMHACRRLARALPQLGDGHVVRDIVQLQTELAHALIGVGSDPKRGAEAGLAARAGYLLWRAAADFCGHSIGAAVGDMDKEYDAARARDLIAKAVSMLLGEPTMGKIDLAHVRKMAETASRGGSIDYSIFGQLFLQCVFQIYRCSFSQGFPWSICAETDNASHYVRKRPDDALILASGFDVLAMLQRDAEAWLGSSETADRLVADTMLKFLDRYDPQSMPGGVFALPFVPDVAPGRRLRFLKEVLSLKSRPYLEIATRFHVRRLLAEPNRSRGNVLIVDDGVSPLRQLTVGSPQKYWLPLAVVDGFAFSFLRQRLAREIDLSIVVLPFDDIAKFASIYRAIEPMMKPGGKVVLYSLNPNGTGLPSSDPALIRGLFPVAGMARIAYSGSVPALWVLRLRNLIERLITGTTSSRLHVEFTRALHLGARLVSGYAGWYEGLRQHTNAPPKNVAAIYLEVSVP